MRLLPAIHILLQVSFFPGNADPGALQVGGYEGRTWTQHTTESCAGPTVLYQTSASKEENGRPSAIEG